MKKKTKQPIEKTLLTEVQVREVRERIDAAEKMLNDPRDWVRKKITDPELIKYKMKKDEQLLEEYSPRKMRGANANKAYAEAKELAKKIKDAMPSSSDYFQRYPKNSDGHSKQADFERAVAQQVKFQTDPNILRMVARYKYIMARLDPSDPTIRNIEKLRD